MTQRISLFRVDAEVEEPRGEADVAGRGHIYVKPLVLFLHDLTWILSSYMRIAMTFCSLKM